MNDLISRQALLDAIDTWDKFGIDADTKLVPYKDHYIPYIHYYDVVKTIKGMPSVQPKQKTGRCRTCKYGEVYNDLWCKCHDPLTDGIMVEISDNCIAEEVIEANRRYKERTKNEHPQR